MAESESCLCQKCGKLMRSVNFYTYKDGRKTELCKKCLTLHVDNFDESTFLWILEKLDIPYIPQEWNVLRDKEYKKKDPSKVTSSSLLGKYLSKMKLKQWKDYGWADTESLMAELKEKQEAQAARLKQQEEIAKLQFEEGKISEAEYKTLVSTQTQYEDGMLDCHAPAAPEGAFFNESEYISEDELINPAEELTQEDKIFLAMKWGRLYKPSEWVELEKKYDDMSKSFDIQDSDTESALILICKTYLKMNQALDQGDIEAYQKLSKVYEGLRKTSNFTAQQNKAENKDFVDCVGNLVAYCEKNGGRIPRHDLTVDYDIVDTIIKDLKQYQKDLFYGDTAIAQQVEDYIKRRDIAETIKREKEAAKKRGEEITVSDEDIQRYYEAQEVDKQIQEKMLLSQNEEEF